jgi:D-glycero-alpha-D-manno-heptose-7-phosphate kinase
MTVESKAPLRLGLAGGGSDVSPYTEVYGGCVVNATINLFAWCRISTDNADAITLEDAERRQTVRTSLQHHLINDGQLDLQKAVYNRVIKDFNLEPFAFHLKTWSDAPAGSGLGSSSTMVVAILKAFVVLLNLDIDQYALAHLAYSIEREDLGFSGGKQDQYAATFGGFNYIEFGRDKAVSVYPLALDESYITQLEQSMILYYTGTPRFSPNIIEDQMASLKKEHAGRLAAMHRIREDARVMRQYLVDGELQSIFLLVADAWEAKKQTSALISNEAIERLIQQVIKAGAFSCKISGAGGGGFMMIFVPLSNRAAVLKVLASEPGVVYPFSFYAGCANARMLSEEISEKS